MQLRERIILNSEMVEVNSNFNSAVDKSLGIGAGGNVVCIMQ